MDRLLDNPLRLVLLTLLVAFAIGAVWLSIVDYMYKISTGKPGSERVREKLERAKMPLTPGQFWSRLTFFFIGFAVFAAVLFSNEYHHRWKVVPILWMSQSVVCAGVLIRRWRRENAIRDQSSEEVT